MVCLFYKLCRWVRVVSSVYYNVCGLLLGPRRGDVGARVKMRPIRLHGFQRRAGYKVTSRMLPSCHPSGRGAANEEVSGRGPPQENGRLVSRVRAREGAVNGRADGWTEECP